MNAKKYCIPLIFFMTILGQPSLGLGAWVTSVLDIPEGISGITSNYGGSSDIAVDSSGNVHIAHTDHGNSQLRYVTNASGAWSGRPIVDYTPSNITVMIDSTDRVHILYLNKNADSNIELFHVTIESGISHVSSTVIDETPVRQVNFSNESIYLDNYGKIHTVYALEDDSYDGIIKYATNASGSWTATDVYNNGRSGSISIPSIVADSGSKAHIAFTVKDFYVGYILKYATNTTGSFSSTDVSQSGDQLVSPSIALDKYDRPGIAFMGWDPLDKNSLKFASGAAGVWTIQNVEDFAGFSHAPTCSLVIDSGFKAHISYVYTTDVYDAGHSYMYAIKYASNAAGSWQTSFIDNNPLKGFTNILFTMREPSLAVDSSDNLYASYEAGYGNEHSYISYRVLKYATNLRPKFDATGEMTYTTSGNWFTGAAGCTGDRDETGSSSLTQEGSVVTGILGGIASKGYVGASEYEFYAKFPEQGGGITKLLTYVSVTSRTKASGTILWFWDGDRPCWGGSNINLTKIDGEIVPIDYPEPEKPASSIPAVVPILLLDN